MQNNEVYLTDNQDTYLIMYDFMGPFRYLKDYDDIYPDEEDFVIKEFTPDEILKAAKVSRWPFELGIVSSKKWEENQKRVEQMRDKYWAGK